METIVETQPLKRPPQLLAGALIGEILVAHRAIGRDKLELVRFSFPDQHGVLRGKTLVAAETPTALQGRSRQ